ncbi:hypothetical protein AKJ09_02216 [Labilithrix luteola]|uniref:Uncharacterized protein n=1 Tax=Labilithrix luteola TaxID=1391654 RepID=A0A0K1PPV5_9BACT|nr:hypothetical protein AKJ09_02216 [Labilithrix luteola]
MRFGAFDETPLVGVSPGTFLERSASAKAHPRGGEGRVKGAQNW